MKIPTLKGLIRRRMLINFRVDPEVMQKMLPLGFRPKLHRGFAIAGICLIRLENIRPAGLPAFLGFSSENAAHRMAVQWENERGEMGEGVYIPRRDTGSLLNSLAGGRLFPGEHHAADFQVSDDGHSVDFAMRARDGVAQVTVRGATAQVLPKNSCFASLDESSRFFEGGSVGYSVCRQLDRLQGLSLRTKQWKVSAFEVSQVVSSFFSDPRWFPPGSITFDHALIMRDIEHDWHSIADRVVA